MECLVCGEACEVGGLCRACVKPVVPPEGLINEHIHSTVATIDAEAWLVDGFGQAHAVAPRSTIGRTHDNEIVVLSASVSRGEHAELEQSNGAWTVRDMGSHNGVVVGGTRIKGRAAIAGREVLKLGNVAMWFLTEVAAPPAVSLGLSTLDASGGMIDFLLTPPRGALRLVGNADGGVLMKDGDRSSERRLPNLEFWLLRLLCVRAVAEAHSPSATRGCVSTPQLVATLPFQSSYANEENVRQVVRRLRRLFEDLGFEKIVDCQSGRGYFLTCPVTAGAT